LRDGLGDRRLPQVQLLGRTGERPGIHHTDERLHCAHTIGSIHDWRLVPGLVDRRPAILVRDPDDPTGGPKYFILVEWTGDRLARIRDFRYARYALEGAEIVQLESGAT
jgi:hypothetical protein